MTKLNLIIIISSLFVMISCGSNNISTNNMSNEDDTINYIQKEINLNEKDEENELKDDIHEELMTFKGNWFDISYPSNYTVSPSSPVIAIENYKFIDTDEAYFLSADGEVEFFVFSPQWGGNPLTYLDIANNEEIESEKTTLDEINPNIIFNWVTIKDKNGKYLRSYYSKQTESTHLIFGIKYSNQKAHDLHKPEYVAFKKSLVQYAD